MKVIEIKIPNGIVVDLVRSKLDSTAQIQDVRSAGGYVIVVQVVDDEKKAVTLEEKVL